MDETEHLSKEQFNNLAEWFRLLEESSIGDEVRMISCRFCGKNVQAPHQHLNVFYPCACNVEYGGFTVADNLIDIEKIICEYLNLKNNIELYEQYWVKVELEWDAARAPLPGGIDYPIALIFLKKKE